MQDFRKIQILIILGRLFRVTINNCSRQKLTGGDRLAGSVTQVHATRLYVHANNMKIMNGDAVTHSKRHSSHIYNQAFSD